MITPMHRRQFLTSGLSGLLTYSCSCARHAFASTTVQGCRMAASGDDPIWDKVLPLSTIPDIPTIGIFSNPKSSLDFDKVKTFLVEKFTVRPTLRGYDDGSSPNALALPEAKFPDEGPDGTVLLGRNLASIEVKRTPPWFARLGSISGSSEAGGESLILILAHEWGHILQFKNGLPQGGPWQMEPHADFMAGWLLGQIYNLRWSSPLPQNLNVESAANKMFSFGDTDFNARNHHGEPQFRAVMVRAGYEAGLERLDVNVAFKKGATWAGLKV